MSYREMLEQKLSALADFRMLHANDLKQEFVEQFEILMLANPTIKLVSWVQNTPSWNDGNACVFYTTATDPVVILFEDDPDEYDELDSEGYRPECSEWHLVRDFTRMYSKDALEMMFGDGVRVTFRVVDGKLKLNTDEHYSD